jgi:urea ABC transporter ATP-binding protein UrtE
MTMLSIQNVHAAYGAVPVLLGVDLELRSGDILVLFGRNGVGKTTLMRALIGLLKPFRGRIEFDGRDITGQPPHRIAKAGIAYVPQGRGIFPKLSVNENLRIGTRARQEGNDTVPERVFEYFPILKKRGEQAGGTLSGGEQQMLAFGRALCGNPKLLLLDEPSEGIQPNIVHQLGTIIRQLVDRTSVSVLLVEQNLDLGLRIGTSCAVMEKGRIVHQGSPQDFHDEAMLRRLLAI